MRKRAIGAFIRIPIDENYHTYGRIIRNYVYAFYDLRTDLEITDLELIEKSPVLFKLWIHRSAINQGGWEIIGAKELLYDLKAPVTFFSQEIGHPEICQLDIEGIKKRVEPYECIGLERLSIWYYEHVQQRLLDHYNNVPNKDVHALKVNGSAWSKKNSGDEQ